MRRPPASLERAEILAALGRALPEAARAPSAHNTQPARWAVDAAGRVVLVEDVSRWLVAADPTRRDQLLSLGAAWEGMDLALSRMGLGLGAPEAVSAGAAGPGRPPVRCRPLDAGRAADRAWTGPLRPVARASLVARSSPDPLADEVARRRTWRGSFPAASAAEADSVRSAVEAMSGTTWIVGSAAMAEVADLFDSCVVDALAPPSVLRELRAWMRLSSAELHRARDGLTAPALRIPTWVAPLVGQLLRPRPFAVLRAFGLARPLLSEGGPTRSAAGVVVLSRRPDEGLLTSGRRLYRLWLALTGAGFAACPMSALLDVAKGVAGLLELAGDDPGIPFAVLRVGPAPSHPASESPRLHPEALLLEPAPPRLEPEDLR